MAEHTHTNRLAGETSPYLQQHAHNPVDWFPWGEEALDRAKEEGKPILLSVGYSACHWCHVMERESFENEQIAAIMNEDFINIKVDREERPDIDHIYMTAVQMMTGQGGWPMTMFLTPDGKPFYGGTYFPPDDRYGRPGFPRVLQSVSEAWKERRSDVEQQAGALTGEIRSRSEMGLQATPVLPDLFDRAYGSMRSGFDLRLGGFAGAPKFPQPMVLDFLLRYHKRSNRQEPLEFVRLTLDKMAFGGMYDQLGGGFHRYSTDEFWLAPHFEKMLYDNAQLAQTYLRAYQATGDAFYRRIVEETLDYVLREMTGPEGAFYSTQDADSEGEEGKFFVWTPAEIEAVLGQSDAELFCGFYDVTERGNFEGKSILNVTVAPDAYARSVGSNTEDLESRLAEMRKKLYDAREARVKPGRDEKILTAWNGMMLAAMAEAAAVFERKDYKLAAIRNAEFVHGRLMRNGRLMRTGKADGESGKGGEGENFKVAPIQAFLEDYACYADGLLRLYEATFDRQWLERAAELSQVMSELFSDEEGRFYNTAHDAETLVDRPRDLTDNATPSGNSVAVEVLLKLAILTGRDEYWESAATVLRSLASAMERHAPAFGRLLSAADLYIGPVKELAIIGPSTEPATSALLKAARSGYYPNMLVVVSVPTASVADGLPILADRPMIDGKPTAYLCEDYACKQPTTDPQELARQLADRQLAD